MNRKKNREKKKRGANTNRWQPLWSWFVWYQSRCSLLLPSRFAFAFPGIDVARQYLVVGAW
jgi:hypothetical protein